MENSRLDLNALLSLMFQAHPWHGIAAGPSAPEMITAFIEIVPNDTVKYELDKRSGRLRIDRPQRFSSLCPVPYGFIPQTYCGDLVAEFSAGKTGLKGIAGEDDPLDICVLTERTLTHGNVLLTAKPICELRMIDKNEADDKIIAVLLDDAAFGQLNDISECPPGLIERLSIIF